MIFKKSVLGIENPVTLYIQDRLEKMVSKLNVSARVYKNDFYKIIQESIKNLRLIENFNFKGIKKEYERDPKEIDEYFNNLKIENGLNNIALLKSKDYLNLLANNVDATSNEIEKMIKKITPLMAALNNVLLTKSNTSIKDEYYYSIIFNSFDISNSTSLNVSINEGCLCLPFVSVGDIPYYLTKQNVVVNGIPLELNKKSYKSESYKLITPGYFFGKFFDIAPDFTNEIIPDSLKEDDSECFYVESYEPQNLESTIELFFTSNIKKIGTLFVKYGKCSSSPNIKAIYMKQKGEVEYVDITSKCFSKDLIYKNMVVQKNNKEAFFGSGHQYPIHEITLNQENIERIKIIFEVQNSEEIEFQELNILEEKKVVRTFNFLESLYINRYDIIPLDIENLGIVKQDLDNEIKNKQLNNNKKVIGKKYLSINQIIFKNIQIYQTGEFISKAIGRNNDINSIEIVANEFIPEQLTSDCIQYYITTDNVTWTKIIPLNREESGKKILLIDRNNPDRDPVASASLFKLKIIMDNKGNDSFPKLYGIVLRIKESL